MGALGWGAFWVGRLSCRPPFCRDCHTTAVGYQISRWTLPAVKCHERCVPRSELAAGTQRRLEEAGRRKEAEEREKAEQRYVRKEYKCERHACPGPCFGAALHPQPAP